MITSSAQFQLLPMTSVSPAAASSLVLSMLAHTAIIASSCCGSLTIPQIKEQPILERYSVRQLDLRQAGRRIAEEIKAASDAGLAPKQAVSPTPELTRAMHSFLASAPNSPALTKPEFPVDAFLTDERPLFTLPSHPLIVAPVSRWAWSTMFGPAVGHSAFEFVGSPIVRETDSTRTRQMSYAASTKSVGWAETGRDAAGNPLRTEHISLPRGGKFGVVVVAASAENATPEAMAIWKNRAVYTAFLDVGSGKNWTFEYSPARLAESGDGGVLARVEAPWPYEIVRPDLPGNELSGMVMVHGFVDETGRFEDLAIGVPARFQYESFVLEALRQWRFRPARRNGVPVAIEVVLMIPG